MTARVMKQLMRKINFLSHFTFSYLCGGSSDSLSPKKQKETLDSFRSGKVYLFCAVTSHNYHFCATTKSQSRYKQRYTQIGTY